MGPGRTSPYTQKRTRRPCPDSNTADKPYTQVMKIRLKFDTQRTVRRDIFL